MPPRSSSTWRDSTSVDRLAATVGADPGPPRRPRQQRGRLRLSRGRRRHRPRRGARGARDQPVRRLAADSGAAAAAALQSSGANRQRFQRRWPARRDGWGEGRPTESLKTALNALTRAFAADEAGSAILVNSLCPGWVRTRMGGRERPRARSRPAPIPQSGSPPCPRTVPAAASSATASRSPGRCPPWPRPRRPHSPPPSTRFQEEVPALGEPEARLRPRASWLG